MNSATGRPKLACRHKATVVMRRIVALYVYTVYILYIYIYIFVYIYMYIYIFVYMLNLYNAKTILNLHMF